MFHERGRAAPDGRRPVLVSGFAGFDGYSAAAVPAVPLLLVVLVD
jgi:hypothetical protein